MSALFIVVYWHWLVALLLLVILRLFTSKYSSGKWIGASATVDSRLVINVKPVVSYITLPIERERGLLKKQYCRHCSPYYRPSNWLLQYIPVFCYIYYGQLFNPFSIFFFYPRTYLLYSVYVFFFPTLRPLYCRITSYKVTVGRGVASMWLDIIAFPCVVCMHAPCFFPPYIIN